jgi:hypothetical protein
MYKMIAASTMAFVLLPAHAFTWSGVTIDEPSISLEDLSLSDGISPGFAPGGFYPDEFHFALRPAPVTSEALGQAEITRDDTFAVAGRTFGPSSAFLAIGDRYPAGGTFTVSPHTRVTVSTPYTLDMGIDREPIGAGNPPETFASFELLLVAANNLSFDEARGVLLYDMLPSSLDSASIRTSLERPVNGRWSDSGILTTSFENSSDGEAVFAFRGEMVAWGRSVEVTPVPEPSMFVLLLAGCAAIAAAARRRLTG